MAEESKIGGLIGRSWLTTVIGLVGAIAEVTLPLINDGTVDSETLLRAMLYAVLGWAAKSFNVSGSSSKTPTMTTMSAHGEKPQG